MLGAYSTPLAHFLVKPPERSIDSQRVINSKTYFGLRGTRHCRNKPHPLNSSAEHAGKKTRNETQKVMQDHAC